MLVIVERYRGCCLVLLVIVGRYRGCCLVLFVGDRWKVSWMLCRIVGDRWKVSWMVFHCTGLPVSRGYSVLMSPPSGRMRCIDTFTHTCTVQMYLGYKCVSVFHWPDGEYNNLLL